MSYSFLKLSDSLIKDNHDSTPKFDRRLAWKVAPSLLISFKYAWAGVVYAYRTQRNFRIHVLIGTVAIALSIFLHLPPVELTIIGVMIALVMSLELINTAIESVVDLTVEKNYHPLAKIAKDCAAGGVLVVSICSIFVATLLLLQPITIFISNSFF